MKNKQNTPIFLPVNAMTYDHISAFDYHLPEEMIAQYPLPSRSASRLLSLDAAEQKLLHHRFSDIVEFLRPNDLLVLNTTKVFPARLYGRKASGGKIECLIERVLSENRALVHLKSSKSPNSGTRLIFSADLNAKVLGREGDLFLLEFDCDTSLFTMLESLGHIPLPPYIDRSATKIDKERYQTIYARQLGAVAAPTAGLHFTSELMENLQSCGIKTTELVLHVGAGTFQPLRVEQLHHHHMHKEYIDVSEETCAAVSACQEAGGRVVAVGTTTLRALETAASSGVIKPYQGDTDLFIRPGYQFHCVDALITNFHLPKSSLLMLVAAFGGYDLVMRAYQTAIQEKYRFYSYGDAMFINRSDKCTSKL